MTTVDSDLIITLKTNIENLNKFHQIEISATSQVFLGRMAVPQGLEPRTTEPKSAVLPITP